MDTVLELENVSVHFDTPDGTVQAVRDVSLSLKSGETLAIVGESGCGKSVLCKSVMKLLPGNARISGKMLIDGKDIAPYTEKQMRKLRGSLFSMLFQDPMTTLNPTIPIGKQITEAVLKHRKMSREDTQKLAVEMLHRVGIDDPAQRMLLQPHYFSGGMRQRCVLAIALALNPHILFADEPTTALDVTVQAQMLDLLRDIQRKTGIGIVLVFARSGRGRPHRGPGRRDVCRENRRDRDRRGNLLRPAPPVHMGAARRPSLSGRGKRGAQGDSGYAADAP